MEESKKVDKVLSSMPSWSILEKVESDWLVLLLQSFKDVLEVARIAEFALSSIEDAKDQRGTDVDLCMFIASQALPVIRGQLAATQREMEDFVASRPHSG